MRLGPASERSFSPPSWFAPGAALAAGPLLAAGAMAADRLALVPAAGWTLDVAAPQGRLLLALVGGAGLAGALVVAAVGLLVLVLATQRYGPRPLQSFARDPHNGAMFGAACGAALQCLVVGASLAGPPAAVPRVAVTVAFVTGVAGLVLLFLLLARVARAALAPNVVAAVAAELDEAVAATLPDAVPAAVVEEHPDGEDPAEMLRCGSDVAVLRARSAGYLQRLPERRLVALAAEQDLVVEVEHRPGQFVSKGAPLARVWPGSQLAPGTGARLLDALRIGPSRAGARDVEHAIDQLVEVAVRALAPAVNDPFTAMACVDRLGEALAEIVRRPPPECRLRDPAGRLRVLLYPVAPAALIDAALIQVRQHALHNAAVSIRLLEIITRLAEHADRDEDRSALLRHALAIHGQAAKTVPDQQDRQDLSERYRAAVSALGKGADAAPRWH